ncbi:aminopeptidase P family protein [Sulfitobacter mediterraneus]|uniref:aminopeptidase P family protein n=1 Tax=Sulfitobacter mediterraneus TaxID=83219 RepID=UPI001934981B|nr:aminopeptidase P family protein [Sulfitobacter mediterraneus]MBM1311177.1 aminopeptidase P family protein [Sulfitobacter mediterraneus]MBM1315059.1 aminopeptidase P family protein [Sulfitobacter mediterraneus]MBM1323420.1 aminopeptidase P family protein [Sulfitobacter mediterraneus]MBM1327332.1 aminopeptidase P family protein [Sulfitobacter mediterraneus]MBM1398680.1 aminopeptidase P family protein [Sulfitobacter mediterraneus]
MVDIANRPEFFTSHNGDKAPLPFSKAEYARRLAKLRSIMAARDIPVVLLTSMHNIAYYSGFLYCSFGRPYGCVVTQEACTTVSANIDAGQPWRRSVEDNVIYTDWKRDNYWRAVAGLTGGAKRIGIEGDHLTLAMHDKAKDMLGATELPDIAPDTMTARMIKSDEEIALIKGGARTADVGGAAIHAAIREGATEIEIAIAGRDAMEAEIARAYPDAEYRDTWVWFQSGLNTDGAHNPVTKRALQKGDILSLNTFPMISGYYTALERTLFLGQPDAESLRLWEANVAAHELGISLIKQGATCSGITEEINRFFAQENLLQYRSFGYGHSFGILSHYYGREAGLELREDIDTVLEPGMVVSMEPMLWVPEGTAGAGGYREHDILVISEDGVENITGFPYGPGHNIIDG